MNSLNTRLLWVSLLVLAGFLGATGLALERAFDKSLSQARQERLQAHLYSLLSAAELRADGLVVSTRHPNERLFTPSSGLYARILNAEGEHTWESNSLLGVNVEIERILQPGEDLFFETTEPLTVSAYAYGVGWQEPAKPEQAFTIVVAEEPTAYIEQLQTFRTSLWASLGLVTLLLLAALAAIVRWGLAPLRAVERDLVDIESGVAESLIGSYPKELQGLTRNLNTLIRNERSRMAHYRHTLANLAHSLKTPLAVLRNGLDDKHDPELVEQVERINKMVQYQLQRAATTGRATFAAPIVVCPLVEKLLSSLDKVYRERRITATLDCEPGLTLKLDEGDLMELFGNLLDNAYKWCRGQVQVEVVVKLTGGTEITISDDGPGIPVSEITRVQQRGERIDTQTPGQGIGLAVVADIVSVYGGDIHIERSRFGGAAIILYLPRA